MKNSTFRALVYVLTGINSGFALSAILMKKSFFSAEIAAIISITIGSFIIIFAIIMMAFDWIRYDDDDYELEVPETDTDASDQFAEAYSTAMPEFKSFVFTEFKSFVFKTPFIEGSERKIDAFLNEKYNEGWEFKFRSPSGLFIFQKRKLDKYNK